MSRGWAANPAAALVDTIAALNTALAIDENEMEAHRILCEIRMMRREWEAAEHHHGRALGLCPNDARIVAQHGELALWQGNTIVAVDWTERAMRLDPYEADRRARLLGRSLYAARRYADAVRALRRVPTPDQRALADLAAACAQADLSEEAGRVTAVLLQSQPDFSSRAYLESLAYRRDEDRRHLLEGLRKAGLAD